MAANTGGQTTAKCQCNQCCGHPVNLILAKILSELSTGMGLGNTRALMKAKSSGRFVNPVRLRLGFVFISTHSASLSLSVVKTSSDVKKKRYEKNDYWKSAFPSVMSVFVNRFFVSYFTLLLSGGLQNKLNFSPNK